MKKTDFKSPANMIVWQLREIIAELQELQRHAADPTCPCVQHDTGENCLMKHALGLRTLASETAIMYPAQRELLTTLADEALAQHNALKDRVVCGKDSKEEKDTEEWSRNWRKRIEPLYYTCSVKVNDVEMISLRDIFAPMQEGGLLKGETPGEMEPGVELITLSDVLAEAERPIARGEVKIGDRVIAHIHGWKQVHEVVDIDSSGEIYTRAPGSDEEPTNWGLENYFSTARAAAPAVHPPSPREVLRKAPVPKMKPAPEAPATVTPKQAITKPECPEGGKLTFALGANGISRYDFEFRIVDAAKLIVSHDPYTFQPNPNYPPELQPRLRERLATQLQVRNIAANLNPDALLVDYRSIDRGAPIIFDDSVVESGNGRVMAILLASKEHPEVYNRYKEALKRAAPCFDLSVSDVEGMAVPILVRLRLSKVTRREFVQEANAGTSIAMSAIEQARTDAEKITPVMLSSLDVAEGEAVEDALRAAKNKGFTSSFLAKLPPNEQAKLVDKEGVLNQDGVRRTTMAIFTATFKGDVGLRLAERFFESADPDVKTVFNGLARSLGSLARVETLTANNERMPEYAIGEDLAKAIGIYSAIKKTPGMSVDKYAAQQQLEARELTAFQERLLSFLDEKPRSARRIASVLSNYSLLVITSAPPSQAGFMPQVRSTKEQLFEQAIRRTREEIEQETAEREVKRERAKVLVSEVKLADVLVHLSARMVTVPKEQLPFQWETVTIPPPQVVSPIIIPKPPVTPAQTKYRLFPFQEEGVAWLKGRSYALLADEMGLGKTPQAIYWGADFRPVLVVVPASLVLNWRREIKEMWRPDDSVLVLDGKAELPTKLPDWTIMSYGMLNNYLRRLIHRDFNAIIIDEAHLVKNMDTQRTKNILELVIPAEPAEGRESHRVIPNRLAVTGTPVLNRPIELFALLLFLGAKRREDYRDFLETYTQHKYVKGRLVFTGARNLYQLNQELKPIMLRRLKKDVLKQLPPKINTPMFVPISNAAEYRSAEINFLVWLRKTAGDEAAMRAASAEIIVRMNALRQLAAVGKVAPVCDWLKPCRDGQGKVLVFCSFTQPLEQLRRCKPESVLYTGALSAQERQSMVDEFQKSTGVCYFMGTIGAAGVGITLTAASRVAFMDLPWTPGGKIQAEDRAHRIGQTKTVEIVNVLARGTIDERMLQLLRDKELIIAQAVDGRTKDEAASTSVASALIEQFIREPELGEPIQYEPELADPEPIEVDADQLEILEGFGGVSLRDVLSDYSWLAKKIDPCNLSVRDVDAAMNFRPLRNIVSVAVGVKAKVSLCATGFVYGTYQLTIDGLTINAETKILDIVMKTPNIKQVYTPVSGQKVFEVVIPETKQEKELAWSPQEIIQPQGERGEQVAMFESENKGIKGKGWIGECSLADVFTVEIGVTDIEKTRSPIGLFATVDTGATFTSIPESVAKQLGLRYEREQRFESSDRRIITKSIYLGRINLEGKSWTGEIATGDVTLLGANTLQGMGFKVNPVTKQLEEYPSPQYLSEQVAMFDKDIVSSGLAESMREELIAAGTYEKRQKQADGDERTVKLYEEIIGEEYQHYKEFKARLQQLNPALVDISLAEVLGSALTKGVTAQGAAHDVSVPLICGTEPVSPEVTEAIRLAEVLGEKV